MGPVVNTDISSNEELLDDFVVECKEHLDNAEAHLLELEDNAQPDALNEVFRAVHSVKGAAGFFKKKNIESVSHKAEAILSILRDGRAVATHETVSLLLEANDTLRSMISSPTLGDDFDVMDLNRRLETLISQTDASPSAEFSSSHPQQLSAPAVTQAFENLAPGASLYSLILDYKDSAARPASSVYTSLSGVVEGLGRFVYQSMDVSELSSENPRAEIIVESVAEPEIFLPFTRLSGFDFQHLATPGHRNTTTQAHQDSEASPPPERSDIKSRGNLPNSDRPAMTRKPTQTIRIGVNVLDELLELIGEVVLGRNQFLNKFQGDPNFKTLSQSITKLHQHVIQTRMQSIGTMFDKYKRTVRDLSKELHKKIELAIEGDELELDRTVLEALTDPLTHLVRNSVDHGIEMPEERSRLGKGVVGTLSLRAIHESGRILIEVEDDGRGLDSERILEKALQQGIVSPDEAAHLETKDIHNFIFHPGFSTKDAATELSGRGVGMDVVKTNLKKLGCNLEIISRKNKGTLMSIGIPLTQAVVNSSVISGLIIAIGKYSLAIPQLAVNEIIKLPPGASLDRIEEVKGREVFKLRDRIIPLIHLEDVLGIERTCYNPRTDAMIADRRKQICSDGEIAPGEERRSKSAIFIVLNYKHKYFGILVDKIEGTEEIVVKRMPSIVKNRKVFAGATILGNGKVSLILDINGMVKKAQLNFEKKRDTGLDLFRSRTQRDDVQRFLIFNNADSEYFAIPVNLLSEVDRFHKNEIRKVGKREFIKRHNESIPLLRLEESLNVSPVSEAKETNIIMIPSRLKFPTGIVGSGIVATIDFTEEINTKEADERGIMGTFFHNEILVSLIDIYTLIQKSDPDRYRLEIDDDIGLCRVLFVDDQLFFRQLVTQYFKSYGVKKVTVVKNGQEALQLLYERSGDFDVVVSDIEMPVMNGYQLVSSMKSDENLREIPIMALTSLDTEQNVKKGYEAGFDAYEVKLDKESVIKQLSQLYASTHRSDSTEATRQS